MGGSIFLESDHGLIEMRERHWEAEERLQELLARYPNLLAGDQMNELAPRQWLLVSREYGIPDDSNPADRWSLDHLFLDQDATPTLVEVKRSTDTRIRREVVGQMLDYASHLVANVSFERIRQQYELSLPPGVDAEEALRGCFGEDCDAEAYWQHLKENLAANKLRLVFVADEFPPELRRIVEFLNRQMQLTDVFAIEVRQFVSPDGVHRTLVPRLVGKVESKSPPSAKPAGIRWDLERFKEALAAKDSSLLPVAEQLLSFGTEVTGRGVLWGAGRITGQFTAQLAERGTKISLFSVHTSGDVTVGIGNARSVLEDLGPGYSESLCQKLSEILGIENDDLTWSRGWSEAPLKVVESRLADFKTFVSDFVRELRAHPIGYSAR